MHVDPSQSMTRPMIEGPLAQHVIESVTASAFNSTTGLRAIGSLRDDIATRGAIDPGARTDLLAMFDSIQRVQARGANQAAATRDTPAAPACVGLGMPYRARSVEVTGRYDTPYNAYAHSFAGMSVRFVLMGVDLGVTLPLVRLDGAWIPTFLFPGWLAPLTRFIPTHAGPSTVSTP